MKKRKTPEKDRSLLWVFLSTFFIVLVGVVMLAEKFSPSVDVEIGEHDEVAENEQSSGGIKKLIDDRLRWIQFEDNMSAATKPIEDQREIANQINYFDEDALSDKEKVRRYKQEAEEHAKQREEQLRLLGIKEEESSNTSHSEDELVKKYQTSAPVPSKKTVVNEYKVSKVYVGNYESIEQAIAAQNRMMEINYHITPFIKDINGSYVLQAGSFTNREKAEAIVNELTSHGFTARIVHE